MQSNIPKKPTSEAGRWLIVWMVYAYAIVGLCVKHWPITYQQPAAQYAENLQDECGE